MVPGRYRGRARLLLRLTATETGDGDRDGLVVSVVNKLAIRRSSRKRRRLPSAKKAGAASGSMVIRND